MAEHQEESNYSKVLGTLKFQMTQVQESKAQCLTPSFRHSSVRDIQHPLVMVEIFEHVREQVEFAICPFLQDIAGDILTKTRNKLSDNPGVLVGLYNNLPYVVFPKEPLVFPHFQSFSGRYNQHP